MLIWFEKTAQVLVIGSELIGRMPLIAVEGVGMSEMFLQ